ncbi:transcriptional regulator, BadM/Rrf2 family [Xylanimonas cellulosilytica DSM 15894]|uniref:Transcriptional regulator, BadM/Rrf2 family n=1 Tax=Xylanimonas cellulosilytica (strain DSM 15894 / JCM 12276 / CECT 5975 / KCTC 9989 / LMG 20990 / NBRC 107835 / XIL07) TaxID=446471 RepID=D1BTL7_XYLCX|nr:Rrf2 family transcriptional regulator [Xylanimonas cellulosilytica]ACZ30996.1 transcriptional regulator, BadM/Rrf2 family [Xylanimonas cellulosilytica DSM 15894]
MRITAKIDYAVRLCVELAARYDGGGYAKSDELATAQQIPANYVLGILNSLKQTGLVETRRGADGGARLASDPAQIAVADVIRAIDGPLASVGGRNVEDVSYPGSSAPVRDVWVALRCAMRSVLEVVTLADVLAGAMPAPVQELLATDDAWRTRPNRHQVALAPRRDTD